MSQSSISIRFDKSHLTSIGTRLYAQSLDLIRELVANSYDADATEVHISLNGSNLTVSDNGSGMDRQGLEQYFTIGSPFKKENPTSPKFNRVRIGEFGIGKFAVLSLCDRFELYTATTNYAATVIFNRVDFERQTDWTVPLIEHAIIETQPTGTRVTMLNLKKEIAPLDLERHLINVFPLSDKNFAIFIDTVQLQPHYIAGKRFPINEKTRFGTIKGEIILASLGVPKEYMGIGIRVKGVLIRRSSFDLEARHDISSRRLTGEITADFVPITTSRSDFISDSAEYTEFETIMKKKLKRVIREIEASSRSWADQKQEKTLSDVLTTIQKALKKNTDIFSAGDLPLFSSKKNKPYEENVGDTIIGKALTKSKTSVSQKFDEPSINSIIKEALQNLKPKMRRPVKTVLKDSNRIVKKVTIGGAELLVSFAHLGTDEKESFTEGGIIFINRDHLLFKHVEKKSELEMYHLIRLITQELIKFASAKDIEVAFAWQGKLIADAFAAYKKPALESPIQS